MKRPLCVIYISGWGVNNDSENLFAQLDQPFLDRFVSDFPLLTLSGYDANTGFLDVYETLGASKTASLAAALSLAQIPQKKIADPDRFGLLTQVFNGSPVSYEHEEWKLIQFPALRQLSLSPELSLGALKKECYPITQQTKPQVMFVSLGQIWTIARYKNKDLLKQTITLLDNFLQTFLEKLLQNDWRILLVSDSSLAESWNEYEKSDKIIQTAKPLPCVLIDNRVEGLRGSSHDYTFGQVMSAQPQGVLQDIAPTICSLTGIDQLELMPGKSLFTDIIDYASI